MRNKIIIGLGLLWWGCQPAPSPVEHAFLGGQIINPASEIITLYAHDQPLNVLRMSDQNRFEKHFSQAPNTLLRFEHLPETQTLLLEAGDSIWLRGNMSDFTGSVVFSGAGAAKNNFLANQMLAHEKERSFLARKYPMSSGDFRHIIDSLRSEKAALWEDFQQQHPALSPLSEKVLQAAYQYPYANRLERYALIRGKAAVATDSAFFDYRKSLNFNEKELAFYEPYITYLMSYLSLEALPEGSTFMQAKKTTDFNLQRLAVIAEKVQDSTLRNVLTRSVAYEELLNFDNHNQHAAFLEAVFALNASGANRDELINFHADLNQMNSGTLLPIADLQTHENEKVASSVAFFGQTTVLYFWSQTQMNHYKRIQSRVANYQQRFPNIRFVGLCIQPYNDMVRDYQDIMQIDPKDQYALLDFEKVSSNWVITALNKGIILDKRGRIIDGFGDFMSDDFAAQLEKLER